LHTDCDGICMPPLLTNNVNADAEET
jgi:hypothetical protein